MPHYAKFMRKKRKLDECGIVNLSANCSAIIQKKLPHKMQDLGIFTIPCTIGNHEFGKALYDSGASINLMPLLVVKILSLGELTPTTLSLQMADISMTKLEGIIEDVLVKGGKFIFPVDFMVIYMEQRRRYHYYLARHF